MAQQRLAEAKAQSAAQQRIAAAKEAYAAHLIQKSAAAAAIDIQRSGKIFRLQSYPHQYFN